MSVKSSGKWHGKDVALKRIVNSTASLDVVYSFLKEAEMML